MRMRMGKSGLAVLALLAMGCGGMWVDGSGRQVEERRHTPAFRAIAVSNGIELVVRVGGPLEVTVSGDDNLVPEVRTVVRGDTLVIDTPDLSSWSSHIGVVAHVSVPELEEIVGSGGGRVTATGIDAKHFQMVLSGGVVAEVSGACSRFELVASGGTVVEATGLHAERASIEVSGGGRIQAHVTRALDVALSGGSRLEVVGRPAIGQQDLSGGSRVDFR